MTCMPQALAAERQPGRLSIPYCISEHEAKPAVVQGLVERASGITEYARGHRCKVNACHLAFLDANIACQSTAQIDQLRRTFCIADASTSFVPQRLTLHVMARMQELFLVLLLT